MRAQYRWAYATYTLLPKWGKISAKKEGGFILRHGRIIRILRYIHNIITRNMHIAQGMPRACRAGGASAARNGHRGQVGGVSAAQSAPCMTKKMEAKSEREWPPAPLPHQLVCVCVCMCVCVCVCVCVSDTRRELLRSTCRGSTEGGRVVGHLHFAAKHKHRSQTPPTGRDAGGMTASGNRPRSVKKARPVLKLFSTCLIHDTLATRVHVQELQTGSSGPRGGV